MELVLNFLNPFGNPFHAPIKLSKYLIGRVCLLAVHMSHFSYVIPINHFMQTFIHSIFMMRIKYKMNFIVLKITTCLQKLFSRTFLSRYKHNSYYQFISQTRSTNKVNRTARSGSPVKAISELFN